NAKQFVGYRKESGIFSDLLGNTRRHIVVEINGVVIPSIDQIDLSRGFVIDLEDICNWRILRIEGIKSNHVIADLFVNSFDMNIGIVIGTRNKHLLIIESNSSSRVNQVA